MLKFLKNSLKLIIVLVFFYLLITWTLEYGLWVALNRLSVIVIIGFVVVLIFIVSYLFGI